MAPGDVFARAQRGDGTCPEMPPVEQQSEFRGATKHHRSGRWEAHIWFENKKRQLYLGVHPAISRLMMGGGTWEGRARRGSLRPPHGRRRASATGELRPAGRRGRARATEEPPRPGCPNIAGAEEDARARDADALVPALRHDWVAWRGSWFDKRGDFFFFF